MTFQTAAEWAKAIDHSTADERTKQLMELGTEKLQQLVGRRGMKSREIAAIVKEIILGKNTNFRSFTNVGFLDEEIAAKLKAFLSLMNRLNTRGNSSLKKKTK